MGRKGVETLLKKFISYYRPHRTLIFLDLLAASMMSAIDLVFPIVSKNFINDYIPNGRLDMIFRMTLIVLFLYLFRMGCDYFVLYWGHVAGARMEYDMRNDLFAHLQGLSVSYFDNNKTGQIMNRIVGDLRDIAELAHHGPEDLFISLMMLIGSFIILIRINVPLTLIMFTIVLVILFFSISRRAHMMQAFRQVRKKHAEINARVENAISGIRLSKAFANEHHEVDSFRSSNEKHRDSRNEAYRAMAIFSSGNNFLTDALNIAIIGIGGVFVYRGLIDMGELVAFILYTNFFTRPIRRLIQFTQQYQSGMAGFERFCEVMDEEPVVKDAPDAIEVDSLRGDIAFHNVTFRYEADQKPVLDQFNLRIPRGRTVALVGPSGVGKTTISKLIPRFYDIESGAITIDEIDVRHFAQRSLRRQIGTVQQDVFIFYGSLRDNIAYGKPGAGMEEIIRAAKHANIHDFILGLDHGYETLVGERGVKLSGGQKQRIAIARVFLKNPPILILDEATSSLDNENEMIIQEAIEMLSEGRTTLVIAHRLSKIMKADEILVLDEGEINERGSHEVLLERDGLYAKLYHSQFKGYIPDRVG